MSSCGTGSGAIKPPEYVASSATPLGAQLHEYVDLHGMPVPKHIGVPTGALRRMQRELWAGTNKDRDFLALNRGRIRDFIDVGGDQPALSAFIAPYWDLTEEVEPGGLLSPPLVASSHAATSSSTTSQLTSVAPTSHSVPMAPLGDNNKALTPPTPP